MSSSSSEYEFDYDDWRYENYHSAYEDAFGGNPFYPTMGNPLVYYSQVPQPILTRQNNRAPYCPKILGRAFKWFTEDRVPVQTRTDMDRPNMTGFANWLDDKYEQFRQSQLDNNYYRLKMKQTAVYETERLPKYKSFLINYCHPCTTRKNRMKSPWRMKRRARSGSNADNRKNSSQSLQYLLPPKENITSCQASEYCPSNTNFTTPCHQKNTTAKCQSYTDVSLQNKDPAENRQNGLSSKIICLNDCRGSVCEGNELNKPIALKNAPETQISFAEFGCQYPEERITKEHAETQYDAAEALPATDGALPCDDKNNECACPKMEAMPSNKSHVRIPGYMSEIEPNNNCDNCDSKTRNSVTDKQSDKQKYLQPQKVISMNNLCCGCDFKETLPQVEHPRFMQKAEPNMSKLSSQCMCVTQLQNLSPYQRAPKLITSEGVQTYDCAIPINDAIHDYPLFMKVVCADKLN